MSGEGGILNRLGNDLFNWETIEQIKIESDKSAIIFFKSGRSEKINNSNLIIALKDFIKIFPDISDEFTRSKMRQRIHGMKTDIQENPIMASTRGNLRYDQETMEKTAMAEPLRDKDRDRGHFRHKEQR